MVKYAAFALMVATMVLSGCNLAVDSGVATGNVVTEEHPFDGFDSVASSHGFEVGISIGDTFGVVTRVDEELVDQVRISVEDGTLKIALEPDDLGDLGGVTLEADVTMPALTGLSAASGSHVDFDNVRSDTDLSAQLSGGSHLNGTLEAGSFTLDLEGGSHATLSGEAESLSLSAGGGSHAKLGGLPVGDADVVASGGSHVNINSSGTLDAKATGGSHVTYSGEPQLGNIDDDVSSSISGN